MQRILAGLIAGALAVATAAPAHAQFGGPEATAAKKGYLLPNGDLRILVFRPEISVGEQTTGGMNEPNADWTRAARVNLVEALGRTPAVAGAKFTLAPELEGASGTVLNDYTALFKTIATAAFNHKMFPGNRLPTKKGEFDWTLGEGASQLRPLGGDFGLFFYTYDSYGSTGRKVAQILGAIAGFGLMSSGVHVGYAGLVDLRTGDLVWLNADLSMGGDPRTAEGADKRMAQLLEDFPKKSTDPNSGNVRVEFPPGTPPDTETPEKKK